MALEPQRRAPEGSRLMAPVISPARFTSAAIATDSGALMKIRRPSASFAIPGRPAPPSPWSRIAPSSGARVFMIWAFLNPNRGLATGVRRHRPPPCARRGAKQ